MTEVLLQSTDVAGAVVATGATEASAARADGAEATGRSGGARPGVMQLAIKEKTALQAAYMPFLSGGGIFVPTTRAANLGDEIYLILSLVDDPNKLAVTGKVVWITPSGVPGRQQGIGVQFARDDSGDLARNRIETLVGGIKNARNSHTI